MAFKLHWLALKRTDPCYILIFEHTLGTSSKKDYLGIFPKCWKVWTVLEAYMIYMQNRLKLNARQTKPDNVVHLLKVHCGLSLHRSQLIAGSLSWVTQASCKTFTDTRRGGKQSWAAVAAYSTRTKRY